MTAPGGQDPFRLQHANAFPSDWDDLLAGDPDADYSHTRHWTEAACRHYRDAGCVVLTVRREGTLVGGLSAVARPGPGLPLGRWGAVRRLDSNLEGTSGGPLIPAALPAEQARQVGLLLADAFYDLRRGWLGAAAMALNPGHERRVGGWLQERPRWRRQDSPTAMVSLRGGLERVAAERLTNNKRNERNRGLARGAQVTVERDPAVLTEYYPLYLRACRHWGVVPTPLGFLQDLLAGPPGGGPGGAFFTCVRLQGRVIGGHLNVHLHAHLHADRGGRVQAWNGVTDPAFARTHFPATLACWGDLVEACRLGASWLDLGASGPFASLEGFKRSFGADLQVRGYYVADAIALRGLRRARTLAAKAIGGIGAIGAGGRGSRPRWHDRTSDDTPDGGAT